MNFRKQIEEDIKEYQENYPYLKKLQKDEWAFNYWILDKLFSEESEIIEEKILDYNDLGIDCYEFYEETKELFLIQNKYYSDATVLNTEYVKNDFLLRPINALINGTYRRCPDLQNIFTKYKDSKDFMVYLQIYVTNDSINNDIEDYVKTFNSTYGDKYMAQVMKLSDIEEKYYGEIKEIKSDLFVEIESINNGTILKINTKDYKLSNILDARYVFAPVTTMYKMYRNALEKNYPIFDKNIREYLGNKGINKNIYKTLCNPEDRKNFFYYNNGITLICEKMESVITHSMGNNLNVSFEVKNPQIVNGCQTVNSIYEVLKNVDPQKLESEFKDAFVMLKVLEIDKSNDTEDELYKNIVIYNNSQNAIDEKTFVSNNDIFKRLQSDFEDRGFLLLIKQSDSYRCGQKYKSITKLIERNHKYTDKYGIEIKAAKDCFIKLEKLLQVILAYKDGGYAAYTKKPTLLKFNSEQYNTVVDFIKNPETTVNTLIDLYLLYVKSEMVKKDSRNGKTPICYYLIDGFAKYECENRNISKISENLNSPEKINDIVKLYTAISFSYARQYYLKNELEYNQMVKREVDYEMLQTLHDSLESVNEVM